MTKARVVWLAFSVVVASLVGYLVTSADSPRGSTLVAVMPSNYSCGSFAPVVRPRVVPQWCQQPGAVMTGVKWTVWRPGNAVGTGTIGAVICKPDCAQGYGRSFLGTVRLSGSVVVGSDSYFSVLKFTYRDGRDPYPTNPNYNTIPLLDSCRYSLAPCVPG